MPVFLLNYLIPPPIFMKHGKLYLIPTPIGDRPVWDVLPASNRAVLDALDYFIVEDIRSARRFLSKAGIQRPIDTLQFAELNEHTTPQEVSALFAPLFQLYPGNLRYSALKILTSISLLIPAFSLLSSPPLLPVWLRSANNAPLPTFLFLSFGVVFQPRTFSAQDLSTSELLRTLLMCGCF